MVVAAAYSCVIGKSSVTRLGKLLPLWQNFESRWPFLRVYLVLCQNFEPTFVKNWCFWANCHCCKQPNVEQIIEPSGHSELEEKFRFSSPNNNNNCILYSRLLRENEPQKSCSHSRSFAASINECPRSDGWLYVTIGCRHTSQPVWPDWAV